MEEIDLLKSYIFQNIYEDDYDEYLNKWGKLITETQDNLMDYFTVYIRANITYYRNSIKLYNFKTLAEQGLANYFGTECLRDTFVHLIDDMIENVEYYKMLKDVDMLDNINASNKIKVFFMMSNIAEYKHNKALYFKLLMLKRKNKLTDVVFEELIEYAFKFILTFQSICSRESKATLSVFVDVQNKIYDVINKYDCNIDLSMINFDSIIMIFNKNIIGNAITEDTLRRDIRTSLTFQSNKKVVKILLSYLEYQGDNNKIDYLKLLWLLKVGKDIHIDHILPLKPDKNDDNYRYYADDESVFLKDGQDFIRGAKAQKYNLTDFYNEYLNVLGNLRLEWSNDNIKKSNHMIVIKEFDSSFNTNNQIATRSISLNKQIINSGILLSTTNLKIIDDDIEGNDLFTINEYNDNFKYSEYNPVSFIFFDETYTLDRYNYTQLLCTFLNILYDLETDRFNELAETGYKPMASDRIYISKNPADVRDKCILGDKIYVETNLSSKYIVKFMYQLIKEVGLNYNDMSINLKHK